MWICQHSQADSKVKKVPKIDCFLPNFVVTDSSPQEGLYYTVVYEKSYYIGHVLESGDSSTTFNFLHSTGARLFDWPRQDDLDTCHDSCIFYGPVSTVGIRPFTILQQAEVEETLED